MTHHGVGSPTPPDGRVAGPGTPAAVSYGVVSDPRHEAL